MLDLKPFSYILFVCQNKPKSLLRAHTYAGNQENMMRLLIAYTKNTLL